MGSSPLVACLMLYNDMLDALSKSPFMAGLDAKQGNAVFSRFGNWEKLKTCVCEHLYFNNSVFPNSQT